MIMSYNTIVETVASVVPIDNSEEGRPKALAAAVHSVVKDLSAKLSQLAVRQERAISTVSAPSISIEGDLVIGTMSGVLYEKSKTFPEEIDRVIERVDRSGGTVDIKGRERVTSDDGRPLVGDAKLLQEEIKAFAAGTKLAGGTIAPVAADTPTVLASPGNTRPKSKLSSIWQSP